MVRTPAKLVFEGVCTAVNAENVLGPFTVLPGHQNFITNVTGMVTLYIKEGEKKTMEVAVQVGVLHVKSGDVILYVILTPEPA